MSNIYIKVEGFAGCRINDIVNDMKNLAEKTGVYVISKINGYEHMVSPAGELTKYKIRD